MKDIVDQTFADFTNHYLHVYGIIEKPVAMRPSNFELVTPLDERYFTEEFILVYKGDVLDQGTIVRNLYTKGDDKWYSTSDAETERSWYYVTKRWVQELSGFKEIDLKDFIADNFVDLL